MTEVRTLADLEAAAFNEGADARRDGEPSWVNPYRGEDARAARCWEAGWRDYDLSWGALVRGRWRVTPLPPVREVA